MRAGAVLCTLFVCGLTSSVGSVSIGGVETERSITYQALPARDSPYTYEPPSPVIREDEDEEAPPNFLYSDDPNEVDDVEEAPSNSLYPDDQNEVDEGEDTPPILPYPDDFNVVDYDVDADEEKVVEYPPLVYEVLANAIERLSCIMFICPGREHHDSVSNDTGLLGLPDISTNAISSNPEFFISTKKSVVKKLRWFVKRLEEPEVVEDVVNAAGYTFTILLGMLETYGTVLAEALKDINLRDWEPVLDEAIDNIKDEVETVFKILEKPISKVANKVLIKTYGPEVSRLFGRLFKQISPLFDRLGDD